MLNFSEFQDYVQMNLPGMLPEEMKGADIQIREVQKNNGLTLHGLTVTPEGKKIAPTIYLEDFFKEYQDGKDLDQLVGKVNDTVMDHINAPAEMDSIAEMYQNFDYVKDRIIMAVVNTEKNQELLAQVPHQNREDLSLIYKVMVDQKTDETATITIRNEHLPIWGVTPEEIHALAVENTPKLLPADVRSMDEVLRDLLSDEGMPAEMMDAMFEEAAPSQQMYVVTNAAKVNGAAAMFYEDSLSKLSEKVGTDLFILPSSVHEVIAVSTDLGTPQDLSAMVREVNGTEVSPEEQLSDHVYRFDAKSRQISLADTTLEELKMEAGVENLSQNAAQTEGSRPRHARR